MVKTVKRLTSVALFVMLGLTLTAPTLAHASSNSQKQHQNKVQKKQMKEQKKQLKQWNKQHGNTTTTVT
jgi:multisubunit Na+/H+ antiporter MnhG subunit